MEINYTIAMGGKKIAIITRKKGAKYTDNCPFCKRKHIHGSAPGHRCNHCMSKNGIQYNEHTCIASDGTKLFSSDGYVIREY